MPILAYLSNLGMGGSPVGAEIGTVRQGGGGGKRRYKLPQYYSARGFGKVELPQEVESNAVAIEVLEKVERVCTRLDALSDNYEAMLDQMRFVERLLAVYIQSRQISEIVASVKARIQAEKDAQEEEEAEVLLLM